MGWSGGLYQKEREKSGVRWNPIEKDTLLIALLTPDTGAVIDSLVGSGKECLDGQRIRLAICVF